MTTANCLSGGQTGKLPTIFLLSYISFSYNFLSLLPYLTALPNLPEKVTEFQFS